MKDSEERIISFLYGDNSNPDNQVSLDKSWDALNFLISNMSLHDIDMNNSAASTHPVFGAHELNPDADFGYGPPRYLTIAETQAANTLLQSISVDELMSRFNPKKMATAGVYPNIWEQEAEDSMKEYIAESYIELRDFYRQAAEAGMYVVHLIN